jgi:hypothetical protein
LDSICGRSINICLLVLTFGVELQILHRGFRSSTALMSFWQESHWSPLASSKPQLGHTPSTYRSAKNRSQFWQCSCSISSSTRYPFWFNFQKMSCAISVCFSVVVRPKISKLMLNHL